MAEEDPEPEERAPSEMLTEGLDYDVLKATVEHSIEQMREDAVAAQKMLEEMRAMSQHFDPAEIQQLAQTASELETTADEAQDELDDLEETLGKLALTVNTRQEFFARNDRLLQKQPKLFEFYVQQQAALVAELTDSLNEQAASIVRLLKPHVE